MTGTGRDGAGGSHPTGPLPCKEAQDRPLETRGRRGVSQYKYDIFRGIGDMDMKLAKRKRNIKC